MTKVTVGDGKSILLWKDSWNAQPLGLAFPELLSFARNPWVTFQDFVSLSFPTDHFDLPLSNQAHQQLQDVLAEIMDGQQHVGTDTWLDIGTLILLSDAYGKVNAR